MGDSSASCYYPNGDLSSDGDIPCGSGDGVACCPLNWSCADNGLCYLENQNYYGRYTCTDQSWQSSGCPDVCTHDKTAPGAEAVLECDPGSYCCDANRPDAAGDSSLGCCHTSTNRFGLNHGVVVSSVGSAQPSPSTSSAIASTSSAIASTSSSSSSISATTSSAIPSTTSNTFSDPAASVTTISPVSSTSTSSTSSSSSSDTKSSETPTSTATSVDQNNQNTPDSTSIILITSIITRSDGISTTLTTSKPSIVAAASPSYPVSSSTATPSKSSTSKASIIAPAVAVPLAVLALAALVFFFWRRRRRQNSASGWNNNNNETAGYTHGSEPIDMYASQKPAYPELDSPEMNKSPSSYDPPDQIGPPSYRGSNINGLAPGDATRASRGSELPGSTPVSPGLAQGTGSPVENRAGGGGPVGGLHITNPSVEQEYSELPVSTYTPYRPPGRATG